MLRCRAETRSKASGSASRLGHALFTRKDANVAEHFVIDEMIFERADDEIRAWRRECNRFDAFPRLGAGDIEHIPASI